MINFRPSNINIHIFQQHINWKFIKPNQIIFLIALLVFSGCQNNNSNLSLTNINMQITSPAFSSDKSIPSQYTCQGENINPPFSISDVPANTQSLALLIDDPDAPIGDWVHWLVFNIDPTTTVIPANSLPPNATVGFNSSQQNQYEGPCPPSGTHHYHFKLYALDTTIAPNQNMTKETFLQTIEGHIIDYSELVGLFSQS